MRARPRPRKASALRFVLGGPRAGPLGGDLGRPQRLLAARERPVAIDTQRLGALFGLAGLVVVPPLGHAASVRSVLLTLCLATPPVTSSPVRCLHGATCPHPSPAPSTSGGPARARSPAQTSTPPTRSNASAPAVASPRRRSTRCAPRSARAPPPRNSTRSRTTTSWRTTPIRRRSATGASRNPVAHRSTR